MGDVADLFLVRVQWERVPERGGQPPRAELCSSESESGAEKGTLMISDTKGDGANHQTPQPERNPPKKHSFICPILKFNILLRSK